MSNINDCTKCEDNQSKQNLDQECSQALKMGGGHLGNQLADVGIFSKVAPLDPEMNT